MALGSRYPVAIQSMTKVPTTDIDRCVDQIQRLTHAGCALVRVAVPRRADTEALARIIPKTNTPLIADIHFSMERALEAMEAGVAKIRLNPGNIKNRTHLLRIMDAAKQYRVAIRIGVNEASIRDLHADTPLARRVDLMEREMRGYVRFFEKHGFNALVLSAKSSDPWRTIQINRRLSTAFDYPIHLGLTHAGLPQDAQIPSAVTMGTLLAEGIGDTIRISLAGDPVQEVHMAQRILESLGLHARQGPELIVCPTCGRTEIDLLPLAQKIRAGLASIHKPVRIAVMGCIVNGPGEAADADIAVCAGKDKAVLYVHGRKVATVRDNKILDSVLQQIRTL